MSRRATTDRHGGRSAHRSIGLMLWDGTLGGAERFTAALAAEMTRQGAEAQIVFVGGPGLLGASLDELGVAYTSLGLARGRSAIRHRRAAAAMLNRVAEW